MDHFLRDLRHAGRSLLRTPGFALVAVLTLASRPTGSHGGGPPVAIINETFVRTFFPERSPLGQ